MKKKEERKKERTSKGVLCYTSHNHEGKLFRPMFLECCQPHRTLIGSDMEGEHERGGKQEKVNDGKTREKRMRNNKK